jgi:hypothetical protein
MRSASAATWCAASMPTFESDDPTRMPEHTGGLQADLGGPRPEYEFLGFSGLPVGKHIDLDRHGFVRTSVPSGRRANHTPSTS